MSSEWKTYKSMCEYDIMLYGMLLHPCLFAENAEHVVKHPSCLSHLLSYTGLGLVGNCTGSLLADAIVPGSAFGSSFCTTLFGNMFLGVYGGEMRTRLRKKYDIEGNSTEDFMIHTLCSPCAICQEAQEIRLRNQHREESTSFEIENQGYVPVPQEMTGK